jgi:hypothetical protein
MDGKKLQIELEALYQKRAIMNKDVAKLCGITPSTLSRMLHGSAAVTVVVEDMVWLLLRLPDSLFNDLCRKRGVQCGRHALRDQVRKNLVRA